MIAYRPDLIAGSQLGWVQHWPASCAVDSVHGFLFGYPSTQRGLVGAGRPDFGGRDLPTHSEEFAHGDEPKALGFKAVDDLWHRSA